MSQFEEMTDPDPDAAGPNASSEGNGATSSSFISNVPLPPRLHLGGNLSENWKQWKQIYDAYETVTNLSLTIFEWLLLSPA